MMLGALLQLNFVVPMATVLLVYAVLLAIAIVLSHALIFAMRVDGRRPAVRTPVMRIGPYFHAVA